MPRPKGAKNKPKSQYIRLSVLNEMFKPDMLIPVDTSRLFDETGEKLENISENNFKEQMEEEIRTALEFTVT